MKDEFVKLKSDIDQRITNQNQTIETSFSGTSLYLASASHYITIVGVIIGVIIAIVSLVLGIYINHIYKKIFAITDENKKLLETHKAVKSDVDRLNELINCNLMGLYGRIKEEETKHIIGRLQRVPLDIANVIGSLLSRELSKEYYQPLKQCYLDLKSKSSLPSKPESAVSFEQNFHSYLLLFFQHYADQALFDEQIAEDMQNQYVYLMNSAFENDIKKTTMDFIRACIDNYLSNQGLKINKYFEALGKSEYADYDDLYKACYDSLINKETRFVFYGQLNATTKAKHNIGKLLLDNYKAGSNTESEKLILSEIEINTTKELAIKKEPDSPPPSS